MSTSRDLLLVDDHPIIVVAVKALIESRLNEYRLHSATDRAEAVELARRVRPGLAIVDLSLGDSDGMEVIRDLKHEVPDCRILVFSMQCELRYGPRAIRSGAKGYLMKGSRISSLFDAIKMLENGKTYLSQPLRETMVMDVVLKPDKPTGVDSLSDREFQIFRMIGQGLPLKDIARSLGLSPKTVESHRDNMKVKLNCKGMLELSFKARDWVIEESAKEEE